MLYNSYGLGRKAKKTRDFVDLEDNSHVDVERMEIMITNLRQQLDISRNREKKMATALEMSGFRVKLEQSSGDTHLETQSSFWFSFLDRGGWLIGLLIFQSFSSIILQSNESLLKDHPTLVNFLTMLIGAGGNSGSQSTVRVIRGIAIGALSNNESTWRFIKSELKMAFCLSTLVAIAGIIRTIMTGTATLMEQICVAVALYAIVWVSIAIGVVLPLLFQLVGLDPAHSSTAIQVLMDISGVLIVCSVAQLLLDSPLAHSVLEPAVNLYAEKLKSSVEASGIADVISKYVGKN